MIETLPSKARGTGSTPGWGTKVLPAAVCSQKKKPFFKSLP